MRNLRSLLLGSALALPLAFAAIAPAAAGVVTRNGQGYANPNATATNPVAVSTQYASPHEHAIISTISVGSADSATSIYNIGTIPLNAIIDPSSLVYSSNNITGLTSVSCGFGANPQPASIELGYWAAAPTALVSAEDWHSGVSFSLVADLAQASYAKRVWEILSLTADPGGVVTVYCTVNNNVSASGTLQFFLKYFDTK